MKDKKEQPEQQEKTLVIDITPTRGLLILLALVLATAACLGILAWGQKKAAASAPAAPAAYAGKRKYYETQSPVDGDEALTACASGYLSAIRTS
jgi:flagellar basal body-associated protein FliL